MENPTVCFFYNRPVKVHLHSVLCIVPAVGALSFPFWRNRKDVLDKHSCCARGKQRHSKCKCKLFLECPGSQSTLLSTIYTYAIKRVPGYKSTEYIYILVSKHKCKLVQMVLVASRNCTNVV